MSLLVAHLRKEVKHHLQKQRILHLRKKMLKKEGKMIKPMRHQIKINFWKKREGKKRSRKNERRCSRKQKIGNIADT